jgi:hypothetical protein
MLRLYVQACIVACSLLTMPAAAQSPAPDARDARMAVCQSDLAAHCASADGGRARFSCLMDNKAKLSGECAALVEQRLAQRERMAACRADADSLCSNLERGGGRRIACLEANKAKVTADCAAALASREAQRGAPPSSPR